MNRRDFLKLGLAALAVATIPIPRPPPPDAARKWAQLMFADMRIAYPPKGILVLRGRYDAAALAAFRAEWSAQMTGKAKRWSLPVTETNFLVAA